MKNISLTSILLIFFFALKAEQQQPIPISIPNTIDSFINITHQALTYVDKTAQLKFKDIITEEFTTQFIPANEVILDGKFERAKHRYWTYFVLENKSDQDALIRYKGNTTDSITLYLKDTLGNLKTLIAGRWTHGADGKVSFPFSNRISIPIKIAAHSKMECYIRKMNEYGYNNYVERIYHSDYEIKKYSDSYLTYTSFVRGFFLLMTFLMVFTLIQYLQNGDKAFMYYGLYVFFLFCFYLREVSYFDHVVHLIPIEFYKYRYYSLFGSAMFICYLLFVAYFINAPNKYPKFFRLIKWMVSITFLILIVHQILAFYDANYSWKLMHISRNINHLVIFVALGYLIRIKDRLVRFVFVGTAALFLGGFLTYLESTIFNWFHDTWWDSDQIFAFIGISIELCFFTIVLGYKQFLVQKEKSRIESELLFKEREAAQLKKIDNLKNTFFTNITHEFRTPLTVIEGMAGEIKEGKIKRLIRNNSRQLLQLINQLLDISKIESGTIELNLVNLNVINYLNYIVESLQSFAFSKKINLTFYSELEELRMDLDEKKFQSIILNLISNAIKHTNEYGKIMLVGKQKNINGKEFFILKISDTGEGISEEELPFIFDRFFQGNPSNSDGSQSTGVGLALVKKMVQLHDGSIEVKSITNESQGKTGTTFFLSLPISRTALPKTINDRNESLEESILLSQNDPLSSLTKFPTKDLPELLIIEDNYDVVQFLSTILEKHYHITFAKNGQLGIEKALLEIPDLIISDVMMPKKDGFEVCTMLKQDERTSHIPIILLTAKTTLKDKVAGLQHGADAYIIKPFEKEELLVRLEKLLELRKKLQTKYSDFSNIKNTKNIKSPNENFLQKINQIVLENISDENFSSKELCKAVGVSNSQLYRKLKALTDFSIANYIRHFRLNHAHHLLETSDLNVSDIAYQCGFNNTSWFGQAFKDKFGHSPNNIRK